MIGIQAGRRGVAGGFAPGHGRLEVVRLGPRSIVTQAAAASPLRLLTPKNHGAAAWVFTATYGGGLVDGDAVRLEVGVGPGASAMLSTQAATKIYRSAGGASAGLLATVSAGGFLALLPDPVVCFASSRYRQEQRVHLETGAGLVLVDWLSSGRRAAGERWGFDGYSSRLEVHQEGRLLMLDALSLDAEQGDLAARMGRFNVLCVIVVAGPLLRAHAARALALASSITVTRRAGLLTGASGIGAAGEGCVIRLAGVTFEEVASAAREYLAFVPAMLGDDPWARKW